MSQRAIYDERYRSDGYDRRSHVRVLTSETNALHGAVRRARDKDPEMPELSILDFGYGTGRVVNEFLEDDPEIYKRTPLRVVAYDVSSVGLRKAAASLFQAGFTGSPTWEPAASVGYVAGTLTRQQDGSDISVVFVHGNENDSAHRMREIVVQANGGRPYSLTCSWYSAVGHIHGVKRRQEFFDALGQATDDRGEMLIAVSATGDLVDAQHHWATWRENGFPTTEPIEAPGDVMYETEIGVLNFYHVFGTDLGDHMRGITGPGQRWWVEGIRLPDDEFVSRNEEQANYHRVCAFNRHKQGTVWTADDYRLFHTVAAFRSATPG